MTDRTQEFRAMYERKQGNSGGSFTFKNSVPAKSERPVYKAFGTVNQRQINLWVRPNSANDETDFSVPYSYLKTMITDGNGGYRISIFVSDDSIVQIEIEGRNLGPFKINDNPALKTKLPRREFGAPRIVLTHEEVRGLVAGLDEPARSVTLLLVLTGLRVGELLALRWRNVDVQAQVLRVCETVYEGHFDRPKTKRSVRVIPFGKETAGILAALQTEGVDPDALVFATKEGTPFDRRNLLKRYVKPVAKKMGMNVTWHLLRHSYATMLDGVGTPLGTMQSLLGHAAPEITREIYLHAIPQEQRRAVESIERLIFGLNWTQVAEGWKLCDGENQLKTGK